MEMKRRRKKKRLNGIQYNSVTIAMGIFLVLFAFEALYRPVRSTHGKRHDDKKQISGKININTYDIFDHKQQRITRAMTKYIAF